MIKVRADWLVKLRISFAIYLRAAEGKQNGFCCYIFTNKVTLWAATYSTRVVYTKTIIHLSVGESGGYLARCFAARQISTTIQDFSRPVHIVWYQILFIYRKIIDFE